MSPRNKIPNPKTAHSEITSGFTLVELLVVITIIGILISLLLPAVQSAREAARRLQCGNNLKQMGLALLSYESQWGTFTPGVIGTRLDTTRTDSGAKLQLAWNIFILPQLEQQAIYDLFHFSKAYDHTDNATAAAYVLPVFLCPSTGTRASDRLETKPRKDAGLSTTAACTGRVLRTTEKPPPAESSVGFTARIMPSPSPRSPTERQTL